MASDDNLEIPVGTINGTNNLFTTSLNIEDAFVFFVNGLAYPPEDTIYGFTFTNIGTNGIITVNTAPLTGDNVLVFYNKL